MANFKLLLYIFSGMMILIGLGLAGIGIWLNAEYDAKAYMYVFGARPDGNWLKGASGIFIAVGFLHIGLAILAIFGCKNDKQSFLKLHMFGLCLVILLELTAGFLMVALRNEFHRFVKNSMYEQLRVDYDSDNSVGLAWNRVQVKRRCCGVDGSWDYRCSNWWYAQPENAGVQCPEDYARGEVHVPMSCCVLEFNQDQDPWRVDPQEANPKNMRRCQEDAEGEMGPSSSNLQGKGCFSAMQDDIFQYIHLLMGLGLFVGIIQFAGIVATWLVLRNMKQDPAVFGTAGHSSAYQAKKVDYHQANPIKF